MATMETIDSIKTIQLFENNHESSIVAPVWRNMLTDNIQDPLVLGCALHQELSWEEILKKFSLYLKKILSYDLVSYSNPNLNLSWKMGEPGDHRITYRLQVNDRFLGHLLFSRPGPFSDVELFQIESWLTVLIFPLRNALQFHVALEAVSEDPVTQLGNRKALDKDLKREIEWAKRHQVPLTLMVISIEQFKLFNDRYGSGLGDQILQSVSQAVQSVMRHTDSAYRHDDEEFVLILSHTPVTGAQLLAERIQAQLAQASLFYHEKRLQISVSVGLSHLQSDDDPSVLLERADRALYQTKREIRHPAVPTSHLH